MMDRRAFLGSLAGSLLAAPLVAEAQQAGNIPRIGFLSPSGATAAPLLVAFKQRLRELGYIEGRTITIESRFAEGRYERLPVLAAELAGLDVDVFVVTVNRVAVVVREVAPNIPMVMAAAEEPVAAGLVKSLARPGGNITGMAVVASPEIYGKDLGLLKEVLPKGASIGVLFHATSSINALWLKAVEDAARKLRVKLVPAGVRGAEEFEQAFLLMKQGHATGFVVLGEPLFFVHSRRVNELAARNGLPSIWPFREGAETGGLISYGANLSDLYRRAATYVDKILKGAKPGDLPMEQPTKYELVINLKTAKTLGLTIPQSLLSRADEVIQ